MLSDLKYSLRQWRKSPGFSVVTLFTLALCIGANTAIFSMVYALLLKPPPFPEPDQLVDIYNSYPKVQIPKMPSNVVEYLDYKQHAASYQSVGLWAVSHPRVGRDSSAVLTMCGVATADFFDVLGIHPLLGRFFTQENSAPANCNVVVLSESYWESQFGSDPNVLDRTLEINGASCRIVGVAPRSLEAFDARVRFVEPFTWSPQDADPGKRHSDGMLLYGRLKPGATVIQAQAEADGIERRFYDTLPPSGLRQFIERTGARVRIGAMRFEDVQPFKSKLYLLQTGVVFVLLIGCINIANLLLARANGRSAEFGTRMALGAGRGTIARQLLIESLLLTGGGALLGLGFAWGLLRVTNQYSSRLLPTAQPFRLDPEMLAMTAVISLAVSVLVALLPVAQMWRTNLTEAMHHRGRTASAGSSVRAWSGILVMGQVATALILMTGAGLLIHSFANALSVDPGFDPQRLVTASISLPAHFKGTTLAVFHQYEDRMLRGLNEIPGIDSAALASGLPYSGEISVNGFALADEPPTPNSPQPTAFNLTVSTGYFETLRIRLLAGRFFQPNDGTPGHLAYIVDRRFAERFFPGKSALGGRFIFGPPLAKGEAWPTIVGVVDDVPYNGVEDATGLPFVYIPMLQTGWRGAFFIVRSSRPTPELISLIRKKCQEIEPGSILTEPATMRTVVDNSLSDRRVVMLLLASFAGLALFLSALGIYGILAYDVSQRTHEIGIRGALGASRRQVVGLIMRQGLGKTGAGLLVGLIGSVILGRYMTHLLFNLPPTDPWAYGAVLLVLLGVALLASYLPARRAAAIDPVQALRNE